ncbi:class I SAM-dependent methyltransferase [Halorientalis litorea]|jgi:SAM-dependent methyltransferase|uniref:class I SAM-dependent methyltransferase n=1 Tax=Halorientalis litorea TaxID=2931977 RepID=UPI001FF449E7|nr:methyltransferase domain-containing protein [Halorientalis litorea]
MSDPLSDGDRSKRFGGDDAAFYDHPRFVQHVDETFRGHLTDLYREVLANGDDVLDLMSSWVSHLPDDVSLGTVVGHGLNEAELERNPALDRWFVQNLNADQSLPLDDAAVDAVLCAVSVQYLQYPKAVFEEIRRVLRPDGVAVVSFSNRMFVQKAIRAWRERSITERADLVRSYFDAAGGFSEPVVRSAETPGVDPFYAVLAATR